MSLENVKSPVPRGQTKLYKEDGSVLYVADLLSQLDHLDELVHLDELTHLNVLTNLTFETDPDENQILKVMLAANQFGYDSLNDALKIQSVDAGDAVNNNIWKFGFNGSAAASATYRTCFDVPNDAYTYLMKLMNIQTSLAAGITMTYSKGSNSKTSSTGSALDAILNLGDESAALPTGWVFKKGVTVADSDPTDGTTLTARLLISALVSPDNDIWLPLTNNTQYTFKFVNGGASTAYFDIQGLIKRVGE